MRYHPQNLKPYLVNTAINVLTAIKAVIKAITLPMMNKLIWCWSCKIISYPFMSFPHVFTKMEYTVTASIVGTAKKKENSAAAFLLKPCVIPPIIDAAERDVPGIMS